MSNFKWIGFLGYKRKVNATNTIPKQSEVDVTKYHAGWNDFFKSLFQLLVLGVIVTLVYMASCVRMK
jgi:hypothetical protein